MDSITISGGVIFAMGAAMGVSLGVPFIYLLINRKRMRLIPLVLGVVAYVVINYLVLGLALGSLLSAVPGSFFAALINGLVYAVVVVGGNYLVLKYGIRGTDSMDVPLSYGLGFAFIRLIYISGAQMFSNISLATAVNNNGFEKVASTVENPQELADLLEKIETTPITVHLLGGVEMICFFCLSVAAAVLIWCWIQRQNRLCALVAAAAEFTAYFMICLYGFGALNNPLITDVIYVLVTVAACLYAFRVYRQQVGGPKYSADPVSRF